MNPRHVALAVAIVALPVALLAREAPPALRGPSAFAGIKNQDARSVALFQEMGKVIQSPRCINCHPRTDRPLQGDDMHPHVPAISAADSSQGRRTR